VPEASKLAIILVAERFPDATLLVISDHGFCDYRRRFHLNTWLKNNGYARMRRPSDPKMMANFEASGTRAYNIGFNGLYINLKGRERLGIVDPAAKQALMDELAARLKAFRDPDTGARVVEEVYQCDKVFSGPRLPLGPDMILGYALGYRCSGDSAMGAFPEKLVEDNMKPWGADHMAAPHLVPGVLFANRKVGVNDPTLLDIAPTIMHQFGLKPTSQMRGRNIFAVTAAPAPEVKTRNAGAN